MLILLKTACLYSSTTYWKIMVKLKGYSVYKFRLAARSIFSAVSWHLLLPFISVLLPLWVYNIQVCFSTVVMAVYSMTLANSRLVSLVLLSFTQLPCPIFSIVWKFLYWTHFRIIIHTPTQDNVNRAYFMNFTVYVHKKIIQLSARGGISSTISGIIYISLAFYTTVEKINQKSRITV